MRKLNNVEEMMQEHCSRIYWNIDDIEENVMFMAAKLNEQEISEDLEKQARHLLGKMVGATTILRSASLDLCEKFTLFIVDPEADRVEIPKYDTGDLVQMINDILNDHAIKFNEFINVLLEKDKAKEINGGMIVLFCESGGNIMRDRGEVINSLKFLAKNFNKYKYEINSKNSKSD
ncbi:MAG: hypothetical protein PHH52_00565 [Patescibacteria group bacterium]|nr:hypothetical protein [Bacteroidales bacterium]MDD3777861.1 hypothetical protein [Patescibacteria group bacterium]